MKYTAQISKLRAAIVKDGEKPKIVLTMEMDASASTLAGIINLRDPLTITFESTQLDLPLDVNSAQSKF